MPKFTPGFLTRQEVGKREFIGGVENPAFKISGIELRDLETHVRGRGQATVEIALGVAFLRSQGWIRETDVITYTGAAYQDATGTAEHQRAHRFPCNPKVNIWNLPEVPPRTAWQLRDDLKRPLAITDFVPAAVNYADGVFERNGACETVVEMIEFIVGEQRNGKPVEVNLVRHALTHIALPGYLRAYTIGRDRILAEWQQSTPPIDFTRPNWLHDLNQSEIHAPVKTNPKSNLLAAADVLFVCMRQGRTADLPGIVPKAIDDAVSRLQSLCRAV